MAESFRERMERIRAESREAAADLRVLRERITIIDRPGQAHTVVRYTPIVEPPWVRRAHSGVLPTHRELYEE